VYPPKAILAGFTQMFADSPGGGGGGGGGGLPFGTQLLPFHVRVVSIVSVSEALALPQVSVTPQPEGILEVSIILFPTRSAWGEKSQ
jgi:hypothetical protein